MPAFAGCHFNAYTSTPPCKCTLNAQALLVLRTVSFGSVKCAASGYHTQIYSFLQSSFVLESYRRFIPQHSLQSIPLSCLRPRISVPRGHIIARVLLQRVGLCLRALRIELLAKLAFALRRLGSFLVVREHGQLSVLMFEV